jgi:NAD(P)-dependent dehydrogenase (short-subunit alcohol dehydrogenase family)
MTRLEGKIAIVTGGGTGIGKGVARALAREGAGVVLASRNTAVLEAAAEELRGEGGPVAVVGTDVTDEAQVEALFAETGRRFGRLDLLVNNAGAFEFAPLDELTLDQWRQLLDVNMTGVFLCTRAALRTMKRQGSGRIINIGSVSAEKPRAGQGGYGATKAAVIALTRATALEGRPHGITAGSINPGLVDVSDSGVYTESRPRRDEPSISPAEVGEAAVAMAVLPAGVNMLDVTLLPTRQLFVGRG